MLKQHEEKAWVEQLITHLGGRQNILSLAHCVSRLRFSLKDLAQVNNLEIEKLQDVKGTFKASGVFQIIIGVHVPKFYEIILNNSDIVGGNLATVKNEARNNQKGNKLVKIISLMGDIFIPIVPILVAGGIILGIRNIFEADFGGWKMVDQSQFIKGLNDFLWIPAQACFWWLPVHLCWSIFKRMGADPALGIVVGLCLLVPPLININEAMNKAGESDLIWIWDIAKKLKDGTFDFGFMKYPWKIQYTAQVIPAIGVGVIGGYLNLWLKRKTPGYIAQIIIPLGTILGSFILGMFIIGPLGMIIGSAIGLAFKWALTDPIAKYFFGLIIGFVHAPIVITGFHHTFNAVMLQEVAQNKGTILFLSIVSQCLAQGAAVLGWMLVNKKDPKVKTVATPALISAWLGVTEPAMYGINLRYIYPFLAACVGAAVGMEFIILSGVSAAGIGNGGWLGILSVQANSPINGVHTWAGTGFTWFLVAMSLSVGITILLTVIFSKIRYFKKFADHSTKENSNHEVSKELIKIKNKKEPQLMKNN